VRKCPPLVSENKQPCGKSFPRTSNRAERRMRKGVTVRKLVRGNERPCGGFERERVTVRKAYEEERPCGSPFAETRNRAVSLSEIE
jgi:hypothetical protein